MEKTQTQAVLAISATKVKNNTNRPLKSQNRDLYYSHLHIKCCYFCQQYKDHFQVARLLGHKH